MNIEFLTHDNHERLLLIFAGWSTDGKMFTDITLPGYDIAVASDYRTLNPDISGLRAYREITVMAWSLGVWAANNTLAGLHLPITLTLAVNGTITPVDDRSGIPAATFNATAESLTEQSLIKFRRRICGSSRTYAAYAGKFADRPVVELSEELKIIASRAQGTSPAKMRWDKAVVSTADAIFPPANQLAAWDGTTSITTIDSPHLPDFQQILDRFIIDKALVGRRFSRGLATYDSEASAQRKIAEHLWQLWSKHLHATDKIESLIEIGYGTGILTHLYASRIRPSQWQLWDLVGHPVDLPAKTKICDAEIAIANIPPGTIDMIVSSSTIQWFNSTPGFLIRAGQALRPGGMLIVSTFGPLTCRELVDAGTAPVPYPSVEDLRNTIPQDMTIVELHDDTLTEVMDSPLDVMRHLQATGVNARRDKVSIRSLLRRYPVADDGHVHLTFNPIYLILQKKNG